MKDKLLSIVAVCIMLFALGGCQKDNAQENEQERKILIMEEQGEREKIFSKFVSAYEYGFEGINYHKVYDNVTEKKKNPLKKDESLVYENSKCISNGDEIGTFYSVYDMYEGKSDEEEIEVGYLRDTDVICWYSTKDLSGSVGEKIER